MKIREAFEVLGLDSSILSEINRLRWPLDPISLDDNIGSYVLYCLYQLNVVARKERRAKGYQGITKEFIHLVKDDKGTSIECHIPNSCDLVKKSNSYHTVKIYTRL